MSDGGLLHRLRAITLGRTILGRTGRLVLLVSLVPILGLTTFLLSSQRAALAASADANLASYAAVEAKAVADLLDHAKGNILVLAGNPTLRSPTAPRAEVVGQLRAFTLFEDVTLIDPEGRVIESTSYAYLGRWASDAAFLAARDGHPYMSDPLFVPELERLVVEVSAPVLDAGEVVAVVVGRLDMGRVWELLSGVSIGRAGYVAAFDRHGNAVAHPDPQQLMRRIEGLPPIEVDAGLTSLEFGSADGPVHVGASAPVGRLGWRVAALQPRAETYALADSTAEKAAAAVALVIALTLLASAALSSVLNRPILALRRAMAHFERGDLDRRVARSGVAEIDALAATFNSMASALEERTRSLKEEIAEREHAEERITFQANHDSLTGLPNRSLLKDRLEMALADARRTGEPLAVMYLDLDRFKLVNDTVGHSAGDELLLQVSDRILSLVRVGDSVARVGGDEYVLLLPRVAGPEGAIEVAERIVDGVGGPWSLHGREFRVTASIGIALYPTDGDDAETLLRNADTAMYRAKERGRDGYQVFSLEMSAAVNERVVLERDLRRAIERDEFTLHYQPQVSARTGEVTGLEALVRWEHPERGLVQPESFIALAEETGLIWQLGAWVLHEACAQAATWRSTGAIGSIPMAVNVSARQFQDPGFPDQVLAVLEDTGLPPSGLELEITESSAMRDVEHSVRALRHLRQIGVRVSIDDFGTGYSSLAYLKRFPVDSVKIDRSFVADLGSDPEDAAIISAIIALARSLAMDTIAEGVETEAQLRFLRERECSTFQGYLFSRALPAPELERLLLTGRPPERAQAPRPRTVRPEAFAFGD